MRKESATIRKCHSRLSSLGLDSTVAFHKSKLILKIYRDVVWVLSERAQELQEYAWELGDQDLSTGLCYLENFAPDIDLQDFEEKVCCVIQSQMLVDVINRALLRLKRYPDRGELYYEILSKQFIYRFNSTEKELLDELNMERSVFYDRKKEAIYLFSICLFGYVSGNFDLGNADAVKNIDKFEIHYNRDPDLRFVQAAQATDGKLSLDIDLGVLCWQLCTAATDFYKAHQSECSKATIEIEDTTPSEDERKALRKLIEEKCGYTFEELKEMKRKDPSFELDFDFLK